jgi:hypothetical protein
MAKGAGFDAGGDNMIKKLKKPYEEMTKEELREATKAFDESFVALDQAKPLTHAQREMHRRARSGRPRVGNGAEKIRISIERGLLKRADAFAQKANLRRSQLVAEALELRLQAGLRPKARAF